MKTTQVTVVDPRVARFAECVGGAVEMLEEAGRIYVELLETNPNAKRDIAAAVPGIDQRSLDVFEKIGRKQLFYRLQLSACPGVKALARCPYSDQVLFWEKPVDLLIVKDGKPEELKVHVTAMTPEQVKQVFDRGHIRTIGEQRAWLESAKRVAPSTKFKGSKDYEVRRNLVKFKFDPPTKEFVLSMREMHNILREMPVQE